MAIIINDLEIIAEQPTSPETGQDKEPAEREEITRSTELTPLDLDSIYRRQIERHLRLRA